MKLKNMFSRSRVVPSQKGALHKELFCEVQALQGKIGHTLTKLKMIGFIEVNGKKFEAKSQVGIIQPGVTVQIVGNAFGVLIVQPIKHLMNSTGLLSQA